MHLNTGWTSYLTLFFITSSIASLSINPPSTCVVKGNNWSLPGISTPGGACRYVTRYAHIPERWGYSNIVTDINNQDTTNLPPACPQDQGSYVDGKTQSEDCLFTTIYTPPGITFTSNLPVFVWVHGGSFTSGSASAPGLDGSYMAVKGNMIVIVLQYRLGVLGFLPPALAPSSGDPNLGLLDVINGLKSISWYIKYLGGDKTRVTLGGQSSGAGLVRSMLGSDAAGGLFRAAILQSDPMTYCLSSPTITAQLQSAYYAKSPMSTCKTLACLQNLPISNLLTVQEELGYDAPYDIAGIPLGEVYRPTFGTNTLRLDPTAQLFSYPSRLAYPPKSLPLLITTTANEAGSAISALFPDPILINQTVYQQTLSSLFDPDTAQAIVHSGMYDLVGKEGTLGSSGDAFREVLERVITDGTWRCANRDVAARWAGAGEHVWVGEWRQGVSYPDNKSGYCQNAGRVCHEDDILPTFHTAPSASASTVAFEDEIASRWIAFITNLDPNPIIKKRDGPDRNIPIKRRNYHHHHHDPHTSVSRATKHINLSRWIPYTASSGTGGVYPLGGDGLVSACPADFWGVQARYMWQTFS